MSSEDESDDDFLGEIQFGSGKEGIVFLVDATEAMFECQQFFLAIQCVINVMKNKAIGSPSDEVAVILFGTEKTSTDDSYVYDNILVVQRLQKISVKSILDVKRLIEIDFDSEFGHNSNFALEDVFAIAINEFKRRKVKFQTKTVVLFTSTCDPHSGDSDAAKQKRSAAILRAQNFLTYDIDFELIPLASKNGQVFDIEAFYKDVFPYLKDENCDTLTKLEPLLRRVYAKPHKQTAFASIPFHLSPSRDGPEVDISVNVYKLYIEAKKPNKVRVEKTEPKKLETKTLTLEKSKSSQDLDQTNPLISDSDIKDLPKDDSFENQSFLLNKSETKASRESEEPGARTIKT